MHPIPSHLRYNPSLYFPRSLPQSYRNHTTSLYSPISTHLFAISSQNMSQNQPHHDRPQLSHQVAKTATAVTMGGSLAVLSGLTLAATVIGLVLVTPLLVIFSPVLVPAVITLFMIGAGFVASGGFGATASFIFYWMYRYATGKKPVGADQLDRVRERIAHAAREMKEKAEHVGHQTTQQIKGTQESARE